MPPVDIKLNIALHENQQYIQEHARQFNVIKAGKRFGKTKLAIYRTIQKAGRLPGGTVWYTAPTYRQAKQIAWWELVRMLPPQIIKRKIETDLFIELFNECRVQLIGCDNEDSLRGPKLDHLVMDEAAYTKEYVWPSILRGQLLGPTGSGTADFISSPNKTGRNWFTNFHEEAAKRMKAGDPDWAAFYYTIYDNPTLPRVDIDKLKDDTPDDTWQLEYMAQESAHAGQIISEFVYEKHVGKKVDIAQGSWELVRSLDWGIAHPTACLWIYVNRLLKQVYVTDEFMKSGNIIEESASAIRLATGTRPVEWSVIDPSTSKRNSQTGRRDMDEFARYGIHCVPGDNRDRGYDIMKMFFKKDQITVDPKCKNLILQIRNVQWGDKEGEDMLDCLRYALIRVHDFMFGGAFLEGSGESQVKKVYTEDYLKERRELNLNNKWIFPDEKPANQMEWLKEEAEVY